MVASYVVFVLRHSIRALAFVMRRTMACTTPFFQSFQGNDTQCRVKHAFIGVTSSTEHLYVFRTIVAMTTIDRTTSATVLTVSTNATAPARLYLTPLPLLIVFAVPIVLSLILPLCSLLRLAAALATSAHQCIASRCLCCFCC